MTDVTGVGIRNPMPQKKERIATPVCGLARDDSERAGRVAHPYSRLTYPVRLPWGECEKLPLAKRLVLWYHKPVQRKLI